MPGRKTANADKKKSLTRIAMARLAAGARAHPSRAALIAVLLVSGAAEARRRGLDARIAASLGRLVSRASTAARLALARRMLEASLAAAGKTGRRRLAVHALWKLAR